LAHARSREVHHRDGVAQVLGDEQGAPSAEIPRPAG
jgi:hypothetical protein